MIDFIITFGALILVITLVSFIVKLLKQPIILGYVLSGLVFSFFLIDNSDLKNELFIFSEIGITFLLFLMGLEFDLKGLKYFGKDVLISTVLQSMIFFAAAFGLGLVFGQSMVISAYIGILFMFSSTLLAAKWIDDKKEGNTLHGKITLSILIIQDLFAILILTVLSIMKESSLTKILLVPVEGLLLLALAFVLAKYILNFPLKLASRYPELLFLFSLSVCFGFVVIAPKLGYSTTIGAFLGGIVLANTMYKADITTRLKPLIIFFNMLFFVGLGFQMEFGFDAKILLLLACLVLLSLALKPVIIYITLRVRGYDMKTSFISGIYLSQLSEFGIIIIAGAVLSGSADAFMNSIAIISVIASMILSSYMIKYDKTLFKYFEKAVANFDRKFIIKEVKIDVEHHDANILFFGYFALDKSFLKKFQNQGKKIMFIVNDPEHIALLKKDGFSCIYNSINNPDFFEHISFDNLEIAISNLPDVDENEMMLKEMKRRNPKVLIIVSAKHLKESLHLYKIGADYVIYSPSLREEKVSVILDDYAIDINKVLEKKISDLTRFKKNEQDLQNINTNSLKEFISIESFVSNLKEKRLRKKVFEEVNDEARDKDLPEYRSWGDKYI